MSHSAPKSRRMPVLIAIGLLLAVAPLIHAQAADSNLGKAMPFALELQDVRLERLLSDRAELSAALQVTPAEPAVLQDIRFSGMLLDRDTPVYIEPLRGRFEVRRGTALTLPRAQITAYYDDFPSPTAMDAMLRAHRVHVTGEVRAALQLSLLGKLAVRERNPVAALAIDQTVPFDDDAVDAPTEVGVGVLALAQRVAGASASLLDRIAGVSVTAHVETVSPKVLRSLVNVRTTYRLQRRSGTLTETCDRLGFWIDASDIMVPAEVLEPWAYSMETATALASGAAKLDRSSVRTTITLTRTDGGAATTLELGRGELTVINQGHPRQSHLLLPCGSSISLLERDDAQNYAVLRSSSVAGKPLQGSANAPDGPLRIVRRPADEGRTMHSLYVGRTEVGGATALSRPIDAKAFGSPLITGDTALGMIAGERTIVPLPASALGAAQH